MLKKKFKYSGTPPYDHPVYKTTSLLRPYSFKPKVKNIDSFYYFQDPVNATTSLLRPGFYGPMVVVLTGFHCKDFRVLFGDIFIVPFLGPALGYMTAMCSPGWGNLVAFDWNDLPVGREFDCKF